MHHQITMEFPSLLLSLQILIPTLIFLTLILTKKRTPKLPPGPRRIPVLGNMHNMISGEAPHRALHKLSQKFGPVMHLQLGEVSVAVISSPEAAKQVINFYFFIYIISSNFQYFMLIIAPKVPSPQ